jgi:hypothetical protein
MAFSELELRGCRRTLEAWVQRRRPRDPLVREQLDYGYRVDRQSVELFEIRPRFREPSKKVEKSIAQATYVRTTNRWRVFWMKRDLKWHTYGPDPDVASLEEFLKVVDADEFCCFFG